MNMINFPIFEEDINTEDISNYSAKAAKIAFKKQIKKNDRNDNFNNLIKEVNGLPNQEECVLIKTNGCSDTGSIFQHIIDNGNCNELYLSTWIISRQNIEIITKALDNGKLKKLFFVVSKRLKELKKSDYSFLVEELNKRKEKTVYKIFNSHAKTFSISTENGNYYTVSGSGNWTENPRVENYVIFNDINVFNHSKEWMIEMLTNGKER